MVKPIYFHAFSVLVLIAIGFVLASGDSGQKDVPRSEWSEMSVPTLTSTEQDMNYLASSPRWELDLLIGEEENSALDVSDLQLLGVVIGDEAFALIKVKDEIARYQVGDRILETGHLSVSSITSDRIVLKNNDKENEEEQIEVLLYAENESD
ncbi:MAG: hypothetical protein JJ957_10185 [Pseudomonadales bacterium]|nr:hypothetical protein [Pseudomonadales bacterium]MBO6596135.1 hypothetical protein [Pseudomonadales bacterium]MBO6822615.1 hypothetical protein [Pseudomonadales bacterium]